MVLAPSAEFAAGSICRGDRDAILAENGKKRALVVKVAVRTAITVDVCMVIC